MQDTLQRLNGNKINLRFNALEANSSTSFDLMAIQCYSFTRRFMLENAFTDEFFDLNETIRRSGHVTNEFYEYLTGWMARKNLSATLNDRMFDDPDFSHNTFDYQMLSSPDWKITALANGSFVANRVVFLADSENPGIDRKPGFGDTPLWALRKAMANCGFMVKPVTHEVYLDETKNDQYLTKAQVMRVLDYDDAHRASFRFGVRVQDDTINDMMDVFSIVGCKAPQTILTHNLEARQRFLQLCSLEVGKKMGLDAHNIRHYIGWLTASEHQDQLLSSYEMLKEHDILKKCDHKTLRELVVLGVIGLRKKIDQLGTHWGCTSFIGGHESIGWVYGNTPALAHSVLHDAVKAYRGSLR